MTPKHASHSKQGCTKHHVRPCALLCKSRAGQAILESLIVLILLVAGFLLYFDFAYDVVSRLLLYNGVARAARADTVGFNNFHRLKSYRVGMIPVSGARITPEKERGVYGPQMELAFARAYLAAENTVDARGILHYERWDDLKHSLSRGNDMIYVKGEFTVPKQLPQRFGSLIGVTSSSDKTTFDAKWSIEDHASLYLSR